MGGVFEIVDCGVYRVLRYRLENLYAIAREVRRGLPREDVMRTIKQHDAPYLEKHIFENGNVTLWVHYGLVDTCSTAIGFKSGALERTWTIGEDSPTDYCPQAPPDIR